MKKEKKKSIFAWGSEDYKKNNQEPPECLENGVTEGEAMEPEDIVDWVEETIQCIRILRDEFPEKAEEQISEYFLDLDYLVDIKKITKEQAKILKAKENFSFE